MADHRPKFKVQIHFNPTPLTSVHLWLMFLPFAVKYKVQVFDTPQVSTVLRSNLMRLYFPVDLTGNLIIIEKLVSGGT